MGDLGIEPSCLSATRLQRAAVANAAHHPKLALHHHAYSLQPGIEPSAEASAKPSYTPRESNPTEKLLADPEVSNLYILHKSLSRFEPIIRLPRGGCVPHALVNKNGGPRGARTHDLQVKSPLLYLLS